MEEKCEETKNLFQYFSWKRCFTKKPNCKGLFDVPELLDRSQVLNAAKVESQGSYTAPKHSQCPRA